MLYCFWAHAQRSLCCCGRTPYCTALSSVGARRNTTKSISLCSGLSMCHPSHVHLAPNFFTCALRSASSQSLLLVAGASTSDRVSCPNRAGASILSGTKRQAKSLRDTLTHPSLQCYIDSPPPSTPKRSLGKPHSLAHSHTGTPGFVYLASDSALHTAAMVLRH